MMSPRELNERVETIINALANPTRRKFLYECIKATNQKNPDFPEFSRLAPRWIDDPEYTEGQQNFNIFIVPSLPCNELDGDYEVVWCWGQKVYPTEVSAEFCYSILLNMLTPFEKEIYDAHSKTPTL